MAIYISDVFYGANTTDMIQKEWLPSTSSYPVDTTEGIIHVAQDAGTVSGEDYVVGDAVHYVNSGWLRFGGGGASPAGSGGSGVTVKNTTPQYVSFTANANTWYSNIIGDAYGTVVITPPTPANGDEVWLSGPSHAHAVDISGFSIGSPYKSGLLLKLKYMTDSWQKIDERSMGTPLYMPESSQYTHFTAIAGHVYNVVDDMSKFSIVVTAPISPVNGDEVLLTSASGIAPDITSFNGLSMTAYERAHLKFLGGYWYKL